MADKTYRTNRTYILFFVFLFSCFFVFLMAAPLAQAACVERCPSGQNAIGNCSLDPGCDPDTASCPQGVECAPSTTTQRRTQTQTTSTSRLLPINPLCFEAGECRAAPYKGIPQESADCKNQKEKRWVDAGYIYQCYSKQATVDLQVSIGGYKVTGIGEYLRRLYIYLVSIAGITAGIMIVWAGIKWLTSAGIPDRISEAKKKIASAAMGLVLVLSSYVLLQTINPALVNLKMPPVTMARQERLGLGICVNREQYPCGGVKLASPFVQDTLGLFKSENNLGVSTLLKNGAYQCDDPENPWISGEQGKPIVPPCEGGIKAGNCTPQYCPSAGAGGCYTLIKDRIKDDAWERIRYISNLESMNEVGVPLPSGIEDNRQARIFLDSFINLIETNPKRCVQKSQCGNCADDVKWAVCVSSACDCVLGVGQTGDREGKIICMPPTTGGEPCAADAQCQSGFCNFAVAPNVCTKVLAEGEHQENGLDCVLNKPGFCGEGSLCIDTNYSDGDCSDGSAGSFCSAGSHCDEGLLCHDCGGGGDDVCEREDAEGVCEGYPPFDFLCEIARDGRCFRR